MKNKLLSVRWSSISNVHGSFDSEFDWTKECITGRNHFARAGCFQPRSLNDYLTNQPTNTHDDDDLYVYVYKNHHRGRHSQTRTTPRRESTKELNSVMRSVGPTSVRVRDIRLKMFIQPITNHQSLAKSMNNSVRVWRGRRDDGA